MNPAISRPVIILGLISLFTDMASEMLYPIMPMYLTGVLGASMIQLGLLEGAAEATASVLKGYFGALSDRLGKRTIFIIFGYGLSAVSKPIPGLWQALIAVATARLTDRVGKAIRSAPRDALLAAYAPSDRQGTVFGFHRGMDTLGAAIGPGIALFYLWLVPGDYVTLFLVAFIPSIAATGLTFFVPENVSTKASKSFMGFWGSQARVFKSSPEFMRLIGAVFIFALVNSSDVFLIMRARAAGLGETTAIAAYIAYNLLYAGLSYPLGRFSDFKGKRVALQCGLFSYAIAYLSFAVGSEAFVWTGFILYAGYAALSESIMKAWVAELAPADRKGSAFGLFTMIMSAGALVSSILAGLLWEHVSPNAPFYLAAVGALLCGLVLPRYALHKAIRIQ